MHRLSLNLPVLLTGGTIVFVAVGAVILGTTLLLASHTDGPPLPHRERPALPNTSEARSLEEALSSLVSRDSLFGDLIKAAKSGDIEGLIGLAVKTDDWCQYGRQLPTECSSRDDEVEAIFQDNGNVQPLPTGTMRDLLQQLYGGKAATLEFIARYAGKDELLAGKYFLVFKAAGPQKIGGELVADAIGLTLDPNNRQAPIAWFTFASPGGNGLSWIQVLGGSDGARDFFLLAPESLEGWRDAEGNIVE